MQLQSIRNTGARRGLIAAAVAALFTSLPSWAAEPQGKPAEPQRVSQYTVINLGAELASAVLNERGQVAFTVFNATDPVSRFLSVPLGAARGGTAAEASAAAAAAGKPVVRFYGPFQFHGEVVTHATSTGAQARVEGTGRLNGRDGYRFVLEAIDGGTGQGAGADSLQVRVTHGDASTGAEVVDYDNGAPGATVGTDRAAVVAGGLTLRR